MNYISIIIAFVIGGLMGYFVDSPQFPANIPVTDRYSEQACIDRGGRITDFGNPPWMDIIHWICSVPPT